jgi:hypothetical protein
MNVSEPFRARAVIALLPILSDELRLKRYAIAYEGEPVFDAPLDGISGVGFAICHRGRGAEYLVVGTWQNENELPLRVWTRDFGAAGWTRRTDDAGACVWDLEVIAFERDAYVAHVLEGARGDLDGYLAATMVPVR